MSPAIQEPAGHAMRLTVAGNAAFRAVVRSRLTLGLLWTLLGTACARGGTLLISLALARVFDRQVFGELGVIDATLAMLAVFGNLGLSLTATKTIASYHITDPSRAGRILTLCLAAAILAGSVIAILVAMFAGRIAASVLAAPHLESQVRWLASVVPLSVVNGTLIGCLIGLQAFKTLARVNSMTALVCVPMTILAGCSWGIRGVVGAYLLTQLLLCLLYSTEVIKQTGKYRIKLSCHGIWSERSVLSSISLPALANASLSAPVNWLCVLVLVNYGGGYQEMGILNVVTVWFLMLLFLPGQFSQVYYPMLEERVAVGDVGAARALVWKAITINVLVCSLVAVGVTVFAEQILSLYGVQYQAAKSVLVVTVWAACVSGIQQPFAVYLVACSRMWLVTLCGLAWAVATIVLSVALVEWGSLGISTARLVGYAVYAVISAWFGLRYLNRNMRSGAAATPQIDASHSNAQAA